MGRLLPIGLDVHSGHEHRGRAPKPECSGVVLVAHEDDLDLDFVARGRQRPSELLGLERFEAA
jgi:hypothetical protein